MRGPEPHYQPSFPRKFVQKAEQIVTRRKVSHRHWQRAQLVVVLQENPACPSTEAGEKSGLHPNSVRQWRKRWCEGDYSLDDRPRSGRPPTYQPF